METVKKGEITENLNISEASSEGSSIARIDNFVVFAEGGVPGDIADVMIFRKKKNYAEGRVVNIIKASEDRVEPFCTHFGSCGGCNCRMDNLYKSFSFLISFLISNSIR